MVQVRDITMTMEQADVLRRECNVKGPEERACQILCGVSLLQGDPWKGTSAHEARLTVHSIDPIPDEFLVQNSRFVTWDMDCYIKLLRKAREAGLHPGICHSHPNLPVSFSNQDDNNERHLWEVTQKRNGNQMLTSLLFRGDDVIEARVWCNENSPQTIDVRILGTTVEEFNRESQSSINLSESTYLHREILAFGKEAVAKLRRLRVAVVGCGGTGSAVAVLLARAGIERLLLIDPDIVTDTNLNRLHGSTQSDVEDKNLKVKVLKQHIEDMGLGTEIATVPSAVSSHNIARILRTCDCVFGCTDDHLGRLILNRLAYFYMLPVIDTGLSVEPKSNAGAAQISGRVTVLRPGTACLICRGRISPRRAREEGLRKNNRSEFNRQVKEGYITNQDTPTPVVGTFTTETATAAVHEFLAGFANLRSTKGWNGERTIRYDLDCVRPTGCKPDPDCPICADKTYWGLGDVQPFLELVST